MKNEEDQTDQFIRISTKMATKFDGLILRYGFDDLVQGALCRLFKLLPKYDHSRCTIQTFAHIVIKSHFLFLLANENRQTI